MQLTWWTYVIILSLTSISFQQATANHFGWLDKWILFPIRKNSRSKNSNGTLSISPNEVETEVDEEFTLTVYFRGFVVACVNLTWESDPDTITSLPANTTQLCPETAADGSSLEFLFQVFQEGLVTLTVEAEPEDIINMEDAFATVSAMLSPTLEVLSNICGWIYTIAWDFSFLPQIIHNWRRKSVIGLSFDYITFNFIGFSSYFIFNAGLYWNDEIQEQFEERNPNTVLHVRINDVMFPFYALLCTSVVIIQCFMYERGNQRVSLICRIISSILVLSECVALVLVFTVEDFWGIDFLYWCSYVKLIITCIKYIPQLYENYKHKSTEGWNIWGVVLDFTGGVFSLIQMFLLAINYDDWKSILVDPTKLGLGLLSIFFNIFFFLQHYVIYRNKKIIVEDKSLEKGEPSENSLHPIKKEQKNACQE